MAVVFLLDLDNTLIDNDLARDRLWAATETLLGESLSRSFWEAYEAVRADRGYVDTLETLARFHAEHPAGPQDALDRAILDFPYTEVRYPETLAVLTALRSAGTPVVLSDGDPIFQPLKIARSGVADAVCGNVLVFTHKDEHLVDVGRLFPAERYIAVDDKAGVLARIKMHWGDRVTTVHVLQGKYADDGYDGPAPDLVIPRIGDLPASLGTTTGDAVFEHSGTRAGRMP